jgi:hypothetical protein
MAHVLNTVVQSMKSLRCFSVMLVVLLSACDADKAPAPPAKVSNSAAPAASAPAPSATADVADGQKSAPSAASAVSTGEPLPIGKPAVEGQAVHELAPNIPAVPVVASGKPSGKSSETPIAGGKAAASSVPSDAKSAKVKADNAEVARRAPVANKSKAASQVVKETRLNKVPLDLSLPPEMVKQLTPPANVITSASKTKPLPAGAKPLLPKMFPDANADPDFQMQGRLLSNEMDLQLRNEARKDVEGAALDFTFKK